MKDHRTIWVQRSQCVWESPQFTILGILLLVPCRSPHTTTRSPDPDWRPSQLCCQIRTGDNLFSSGFVVFDCRHESVRRVCTVGFGNSTGFLLHVVGWWRSTSLPGPHQGAPVVFTYTYLYTNTVHLIYIGAYVCKYIGHETTNWFGCGGRRLANYVSSYFYICVGVCHSVGVIVL
jgi:hypothetical protein